MSNHMGEYGTGAKKRGWRKNLVAIWSCFLLVSHYFQTGVCLGFVLFSLGLFCWRVNGAANCLVCLLSQAGLVSPSTTVWRYCAEVAFNFFAVIWGIAYLLDDSSYHRCWSGSFCLARQNWILMKKLMYWKITPNGIKLHFAYQFNLFFTL